MIDKYIGIVYKYKGDTFSGCDCFGLYKLIYKEERNIDLPSYIYTEKWYKENKNHIVENIEGIFYRVDAPYKLYDGLIFFLDSKFVANHIGIWISDNKFLHVHENSTSRIEKFNDFWKNKLYTGVRYSGTCNL